MLVTTGTGLAGLLGLLASLLIAACSPASDLGESADTSALSAKPQVFDAGARIQLSFPEMHPKNIAVRNPAGVWYSIQSEMDGTWLMPPAAFDKVTSLTIDTGKIKGIGWIDGRQVNERIFVERGDYLIYMADNLETEPENTFHFMVTVTLQ